MYSTATVLSGSKDAYRPTLC